MGRVPEPCLCGDPYCRRCFPFDNRPEPEDEDDAYERHVQRQLDDADSDDKDVPPIS